MAEAPVDIPLAALEAELAQLIAATPQEAVAASGKPCRPDCRRTAGCPGGQGMPEDDAVGSDWSKSEPAMPPLESGSIRADHRRADELADALVPPELPAEVAAEPSVSFNWSLALAGVWLIGSVAWLTLAVARVVRFRRALQLAEPAGDDLTGEVARLAARIGLARSPAVRLTRRRVPPLVWGLVGRPTMLLPIELVQSLSDEARETLLVHELAHLTRRATCAVAGAGRDRSVLVAPGGLVGAAQRGRGRGAMLRCPRGGDVAARGPGLCRDVVGHGGVFGGAGRH